MQTTSKAVGAALNQIPGLPKELRITLRHLPEVAEALLAVVETADFGPVLQLFVVEKELAELFPFPIELFTMAHALIQKDKDMVGAPPANDAACNQLTQCLCLFFTTFS